MNNDNITSIGDMREHRDDSYQVDEIMVRIETMMQFCPIDWKLDGLTISAKDKGTSQFFVTFADVHSLERHLAFDWCKKMLILFFGGFNFLSATDDDNIDFHSDPECASVTYIPEVCINLGIARHLIGLEVKR